MARNHARILTAIWHDGDWRDLTPEAQHMYFVALSQPTLSYCGVVAFTTKRWASMARGLTVAKVKAVTAELARRRYVLVDPDTEELWIRSFLKHDGVLDQPGMVTAMAKDYLAIQSRTIRDQVLDALGPGWLATLPGRFPKAFGDGFPDGFPDGFLDDYGKHFPDGFEDAMGGGSPPPTGNGSASVRTRVRTSPTPPPSPSPTPPPRPPAPTEPADVEPSANGSKPAAPVAAEEEDAELDALVEARLDRRLQPDQVAKYGAVVDRQVWRAKTRRTLLAEVAEHGRGVLAVVAAPAPDPLEASAAAQRAIAERNEARLRGEFECQKCADVGVVETEGGVVERCDCVASSSKAAVR